MAGLASSSRRPVAQSELIVKALESNGITPERSQRFARRTPRRRARSWRRWAGPGVETVATNMGQARQYRHTEDQGSVGAGGAGVC